jgi:maltose alpha-D-glucosyltransferase/alpha-amylase
MQPRWIKDAVIYQIYPQSFQDSNADGIGDFQGIIKRLDHIKGIGANTLWLNPCFDSPFGDAGYDVRDFYKVAPRYGTEADLVGLFQEAHRRDLKVVLDLVAGHTSMDNPWFVAEAKNPKAPEANRYIWKNRDFDPARGPGRDDFVANFFWYQPALNFGYESPTEPWQDGVDAPGPRRNRAELRSIMAHWFDLGCDGFRVDMAGSLVKGEKEGNAATVALWREIRTWMEETYPDRALLAEWSQPDVSIPAGFHIDFMMHFNAPGYPSLFFNGAGTLVNRSGAPCYFGSDGRGSLSEFRKEYIQQLSATRGRGYISLPTANHDYQRLRVGPRGWDGLRPAWVFLMTQAGIPTIYYGDEIGMRFVPEAPPKEGSTLTGVNAVNAGDTANGERAGTRTPMQWNHSANAGFSTAAPESLYLPLDNDPDRPTVETQEADPDSLLHFVRNLLRLRRQHPGLATEGGYEILNPEERPYPLVVKRVSGDRTYLILINPAGRWESLTVTHPEAAWTVLLDGGATLENDATTLTVSLPPHGYGIIMSEGPGHEV